MPEPIDFSVIMQALDALTEAVNENNQTNEKLLSLCESWIERGQDDAVIPAVRVTYLECAQDLARIMGRDKREGR